MAVFAQAQNVAVDTVVFCTGQLVFMAWLSMTKVAALYAEYLGFIWSRLTEMDCGYHTK